MRRYTIGLLVVLAVTALGLTACNEQDAASIKTICKALIGPIRYNAENKASLYFAGQKLVFTLKQRNQVWDGLRCTSLVGDDTQIVQSVPAAPQVAKATKGRKVKAKAHKARAARAAPVAQPAEPAPRGLFTSGSWHQNDT